MSLKHILQTTLHFLSVVCRLAHGSSGIVRSKDLLSWNRSAAPLIAYSTPTALRDCAIVCRMYFKLMAN